jgi:hypothetical protein
LAKEAKVACLNTLLAVDVEMDDIDLGDVHSILGLSMSMKKQKI